MYYSQVSLITLKPESFEIHQYYNDNIIKHLYIEVSY